jgi:hypothetical protein
MRGFLDAGASIAAVAVDTTQIERRLFVWIGGVLMALDAAGTLAIRLGPGLAGQIDAS